MEGRAGLGCAVRKGLFFVLFHIEGEVLPKLVQIALCIIE
jgi:hypothetical protein